MIMGKELTKSDVLKKNLVEAMVKTMGIVTHACKLVDCSRETFYKYMKEDAVFKAQINDIGEMALDFAESKLHNLIRDENLGAVIFYLKTKGKVRGYIERTEFSLFKEQPLFPYKEGDIIDIDSLIEEGD